MVVYMETWGQFKRYLGGTIIKILLLIGFECDIGVKDNFLVSGLCHCVDDMPLYQDGEH